MSDKLDIHDLMRGVNEGDVDFFNNLSDSMKKSFAPIVVNRWLSGTHDKNKILFINQLINPVTFPLHAHPDLLYKLMVIAASVNKDYKWVPKKGKSKGFVESSQIIASFIGCSLERAREYCGHLTLNDVIEYADELGIDADTVKKVKAEWK